MCSVSGRRLLRPHSDSVSIFVLNSLKFVPSFFALDNISVATCVFPATLVIANAGVALIIYLRRQQVSWQGNSSSSQAICTDPL